MVKMLKENELAEAARIIRDGGIVAARTETVFGIAVLLSSAPKIFRAKGRDENKRLVLQFPTLKAAQIYFGEVIGQREAKLLKHFPVGLTLVLKNDVAVRIPADPLMKKLLTLCGEPLVVTSANISGEPASTTYEDVVRTLGDRLDAIVVSRPSKVGVASTILKVPCPGKADLEIVREGAIPTKAAIDFWRKM